MDFEPPLVIEARMLSKMPNRLRRRGEDCSLRGAAFDRAGNLFLSDTPSARILRLSRAGQWELVVETGGSPQGIAVHQDGSLWVADARRGLLRVGPGTEAVRELLGRSGNQVAPGAKDLVFDGRGNCYFTSPGDSGMHDQTGRVFRLGVDGRLDLLLSNLSGPCGIVLDRDATKLFVAVDQGNALWQADLGSGGSIGNVGLLRGFFGGSGPQGSTMDATRHLIVAHAGLGCAFIVNMLGEITHAVQARHLRDVTSVAFRPGTEELLLVDSQQGAVWTASMPDRAPRLFSHG
ncbi:SMP-30/gluconolactonase/LRE family protein [Hydrogenophaga defluvii]|uniref:SMP-30/gluconolactonase/LRE family protein n=1 Tax=Hydrogenophaga defluvii TaxID=249410 RepID=A0ABW2S9R9_9BURK